MIDPLTIGTALTALGVSPAVGRLLERILGPLSDEAGKVLVEGAFKERRLRLAARAAEGLTAAGIEPVPVPPKLLFPIFGHASLEDDAGLSEKWAALLANAADGEKTGAVLPGFPDALSKLTPLAALYLDTLYERDTIRLHEISPAAVDRFVVLNHLHLPADEIDVVVSLLDSLGLVRREGPVFARLSEMKIVDANYSDQAGVWITPLGKRFVEVCRMPQPKASE